MSHTKRSKWYFIAVFMVLLFSILAYIYFMKKNNNRFEDVVSQKDYKKCSEIDFKLIDGDKSFWTNEQVRNYCIFRIAEELDDNDICKKIQSESGNFPTQEDCINNLKR